MRALHMKSNFRETVLNRVVEKKQQTANFLVLQEVFKAYINIWVGVFIIYFIFYDYFENCFNFLNIKCTQTLLILFFYIIEKHNREVHRTSLSRLLQGGYTCLLCFWATYGIGNSSTSTNYPPWYCISIPLVLSNNSFHFSIANAIVIYGTSVHLPVWNDTSVNWFQNRYETSSNFYIQNLSFTWISVI